jgi:hypothetical protein
MASLDESVLISVNGQKGYPVFGLESLKFRRDWKGVEFAVATPSCGRYCISFSAFPNRSTLRCERKCEKL